MLALKIETTKNLTHVLNVSFNLRRSTYQLTKKPNNNLTYINASSNHPSQIIKHLNQTINEKLPKYFSSAEISEQSKPDYEKNNAEMWLQSKNAVHTTKFAAK